jgi:hypothetical protein
MAPDPLGLRQAFAKQSANDKAHLFVEFKRRGIGLVDPAPRTDWSWLYLAQHHGLPTSLLDWTESSHIALFFALKRVAGQKRERQDACVWMLNPGELNERGWRFCNVVVVGDEDKEARGLLNPYLHGKPAQWKVEGDEPPLLAIIPEHVSPRLRAQRGAFVAFGNDEDALNQIVVDANHDKPGTSIARPFVIEYNAARVIERELDVSGVTESDVFPDLDGLCGELARRHDSGTP